MATMTTTEVIGFCDQVIEFVAKNQAAIEAKGINVGAWMADIGALKQTAVERDAEQETLKAQLKAKTAETKAALNAAYAETSTRLDAMIGALGKGTPLAKQAAKIRSGVLTQRAAKKSA
jgi:hypothetical protein